MDSLDEMGVAMSKGSGGIVSRDQVFVVLREIDRRSGGDGCLYLIGETSHAAEGWRDWTTQIEFFADVPAKDRPLMVRAVEEVSRDVGAEIIEEFPGDLIPLPDGYAERARDLSDTSRLAGLRCSVRHFDPYSVVYRFVARGDEPDYHIALMYLDRGWITFEELDERLDLLLPRFSLQTIAQDPAEFRRKYRGLRQMWRKSLRPGEIHRATIT